MATLRQRAGALIYDWPRYLATPWVRMRNRGERISSDGRGVRCEWQFTSELHLANVFAAAGSCLMRRAFGEWPVELRDAPRSSGAPEVSFVIGHRGLERLPHLLATLRSIAGQRDVSVECIVVEQAVRTEIRDALPSWVRYVHTPVLKNYDYNRAWTLNVGARHARGDLLVLHDNDMICPDRYALEALTRMREGWEFLDLKRFTFYLSESDTRKVFETGQVRTDVSASVVQNLRGATIVARREAYIAVAGFDESFVGWGGEDLEFWERAAVGGRVYEFGYLPFVHLWHAPQKAKLAGPEAPAIRRYYELADVSPEARIARLSARDWGGLNAPRDA
jgi:GT2 family glycosyltransferase